MKTEYLIGKRDDFDRPIIYQLNYQENCIMVRVGLLQDEKYVFFRFGILEKTTKRGWTVKSVFLTLRLVKIFLPRENFELVDELPKLE